MEAKTSRLSVMLMIIAMAALPLAACDDGDDEATIAGPTTPGGFVYTANNGLGANSVSGYAVNRTTGLLTAVSGSPVAAGNTPISVAVHPTKKLLYAANSALTASTSAINVYSIGDSSGALTPIANSPFATATQIFNIAIHPNGTYLFAANAAPTVSVFSLNATSGAPTLISNAIACGGVVIWVAVDPTGKFVYAATQGGGGGAANNGLICAYALNPTTGALTPVAGSPYLVGNVVAKALAIDPTGKYLFATTFDSLRVYAINATSGALSAVGAPYTVGPNPQAVAVDPAGTIVYVGNDSIGANASIINGYAINAATGVLSPIASNPLSTGDTPIFIAFDPSGNFAYVANGTVGTITVYSVNKTTGALTSTGSPIANGANSYPRSIAVLRL